MELNLFYNDVWDADKEAQGRYKKGTEASVKRIVSNWLLTSWREMRRRQETLLLLQGMSEGRLEEP